MRFLINSVLAAKPKLTSSRTSLASFPFTGTSSSVPTTIKVASGDAATKVKKKWGQQCGVSCGCVVRFEIDLDDQDRVVTAEYTAQRIVMTSVTSKNDQQQQNKSKDSKRLQPLLSNRTGRLQYLPSNCKALHQLSTCVVHYFVNRPLWQIMNYHEFQNSRSSKAFQQAVLTAQKLTEVDIPTEATRSPKAHLNKKANQQPANHNHCFDLVEDAISALLKGYVPPPREPDRRLWNYQRALSHHLTELSENSCSLFDLDDDSREKTDSVSVASIPWHERAQNSSLFEIPRLLSWRNDSGDERDEDSMALYISPAKNDAGMAAFRWTALDWMDWFENDRQKQQQQIQIREREASLEKMNPLGGPLSSLSHAADWLTYVDTIQQLDQSKSEQSA